MTVPTSFEVIDVARQWGVPPWAVLSGEPPDDDERRRWYLRARLKRRLGV